MKLTDEQQAMMDGKYGEGAAYAMKIQFALGEAFDAPRMVPITRAHIALSNQAGDLWFAEKMYNAGARCRIHPTVNPGFCLGYFRVLRPPRQRGGRRPHAPHRRGLPRPGGGAVL